MVRHWLIVLFLVSLGFSQTLKVGTQAIPSTQSLAVASGILKEELQNIGVELQTFDFQTGRDINNALASKSIDIGFLGATPYVAGILSRLEVDVFYINFVSKKTEGLAVKSDIKSFAQLKGKKIGVPFGTSAHYGLLSALKLNNIALNEVILLDLNPSDLLIAWQRNDIQAAYVWDITLSTLKDSTLLYSDEDLLNAGIVLSDISVVRREYSKENPNIVKAYVKALDRAYTLYKTDREKAAALLSKSFGLSVVETKRLIAEDKGLWLDSALLKDSKFLGTPENKGSFSDSLKDVAEFLHTNGVLRRIPKNIDYTQFVNPSFLQ